MKYVSTTSEPLVGVSGVGDNGEVITFEADKNGAIDVPADFQEALRFLADAPVRKLSRKET